MKTSQAQPQLQAVTGFRSEAAFNALREIIYEVDAENSVSITGAKEFNDNEEFNLLIQRYVRIPGLVLTHSHWNRLVFYAAGEVKADEDNRYSLQAIQQNEYGAAVLFLLLLLIRSYGVAHASKLLYGNCRSLQVAHPEHDVAHAASFFLLSNEVDINETTGPESVPSIVLRKLMEPASVMETIKRGVRCFIRNYIRTIYNTEAFNPLSFESIDVHSDRYNTENCFGYGLEDPLEELQAKHLLQMLNNTEGFTQEELKILRYWRSAEGQSICAGGRNFRAQLRLLAPTFGITERRSRTLAANIIRKYREQLGITCKQEEILVKDFKSKATRSKTKRGLLDSTRRLKSGKGGAKVVLQKIVIDKIQSNFVDYEDGQLLRSIAGTGDQIFANLKEPMKTEE